MKSDSLNRRDALAVIAAGMGVAACGPGEHAASAAGEGAAATRGQAPEAAGGESSIWAKDPSPFIRHGTNLETRLEDLHGFLTPNDLFFVRNHAPTPLIDAGSYTLTVGGPGAEREVRLGLDDLWALPSQTLIAYIECAGNWRGFFRSVTGRTASGSQWGTGAVGCAEWTGPRLADVLALAGVRADAVDVNVIGFDEAEWARPRPLAKALDPDTILALTMNGGAWAPARVIGPAAAFPHAWSRFELEWKASPGSHLLRTRATDAARESQPLEGVYNEKGYLLNAALPHPVEVA